MQLRICGLGGIRQTHETSLYENWIHQCVFNSPKDCGSLLRSRAVWILLSDKILELLVRDRAVMIDVSILKGWCYVSVTTLILYAAIRRWTSQIEHSEKAARLTDAKYRELVESANSIIMRRDITGRITFINEFAQDFFGYSKEEILGRNTVGTIVPEVDRSGRNLKAMIEDIGKHPERYKNNENENMRANGERVWIAWTNKPLLNENGEIVEVLSIGNDITERKQAEQALHKSNARISHLNDVLRAIRDVSSIIESEKEPLRLLTGVCNSLVKTRGYFMVWIGQPERGSKRVLPVAQSGEGSEFLRDATISWDDSPTGRGPAGTAMRERRPVVFDDLINDERFAPWKDLVNAYGEISTASVPILHHERLFGTLTVNAGRTQAFDEEEIGLLSTLAADVARALQSIEDERARKQAEGALRESEERFRKLFEESPIGIAFLGKQREIILTNRRYCDFLGYSEAEIIELGPKGLLHPDDWGPSMELSAKLRADEIPLFHMEQRYIRKDGTVVWADTHIIVFRDKNGQLVHTIGWVSDITKRKRAEEEKGKLEAELHQARKMEAIGLLAGGIAHDFNNVLAAIMGFTELSMFKISEDSPVRGNLEQVLKAASRASQLVKQILTFTHQGVQERRPVRIAPIVRETLKLLRSSLPSTIEIRHEVAVNPGEDVVLADPGQIHQVLMNLGTNAGHAMRAKGGTLSVELSVIADASQLSVYPDLKGGTQCLHHCGRYGSWDGFGSP